MKLIIFPLFFIILIAISVQLINFSPLYSGGISNTGLESGENSLQLIGISDMIFDISLGIGFLGLMISSALIGILSGLQIEVIGSTLQLSEQAQKILQIGLFYVGLWGIFSLLASTGLLGIGIFSIPVFGILFYLILTLLYVLGIQQQISNSG